MTKFTLEEEPRFCQTCGAELVPHTEKRDGGFDPITGQPLDGETVRYLHCSRVGRGDATHDSWRLLSSGTWWNS